MERQGGREEGEKMEGTDVLGDRKRPKEDKEEWKRGERYVEKEYGRNEGHKKECIDK